MMYRFNQTQLLYDASFNVKGIAKKYVYIITRNHKNSLARRYFM